MCLCGNPSDCSSGRLPERGGSPGVAAVVLGGRVGGHGFGCVEAGTLTESAGSAQLAGCAVVQGSFQTHHTSFCNRTPLKVRAGAVTCNRETLLTHLCVQLQPLTLLWSTQPTRCNCHGSTLVHGCSGSVCGVGWQRPVHCDSDGLLGTHAFALVSFARSTNKHRVGGVDATQWHSQPACLPRLAAMPPGPPPPPPPRQSPPHFDHGRTVG
jgi:hypothetical protein